jgi:protein SSD1
METLLVKTMSRAKYVVAGRTPEEHLGHFAFNLPIYTHFCNPSRRYADIVVHRQLEAALSEGAVEFNEDIETLAKMAEQCNTKKDSAQSAQEQSVHIEACRVMDKKRAECEGDLISEGIVICVYESAFDVLIPEYGFEKRVHCDQLPLKKAEFRKETRVLELYWEKGIASSAYIPEDERPKGHNANGDQKTAKVKEEAQGKSVETGTMSTDDEAALFEEDADDAASDLADMTAGVSLSPHEFVQSESKSGKDQKDGTKAKWLGWFSLREEDGEYIQDVRELTRVPIILMTDLTKSPP